MTIDQKFAYKKARQMNDNEPEILQAFLMGVGKDFLKAELDRRERIKDEQIKELRAICAEVMG